jgi:hypothetical protein
MYWQSPPAFNPASCLVRVLEEPDGRFTAHLLGELDLRATAATAAEAVEQLRARLQFEVNAGRLLSIELPRQNPVLERFGSAKDDPEFEEYLEEIRKFREEVDRREGRFLDSDECSDTSLTPTT